MCHKCQLLTMAFKAQQIWYLSASPAPGWTTASSLLALKPTWASTSHWNGLPQDLCTWCSYCPSPFISLIPSYSSFSYHLSCHFHNLSDYVNSLYMGDITIIKEQTIHSTYFASRKVFIVLMKSTVHRYFVHIISLNFHISTVSWYSDPVYRWVACGICYIPMHFCFIALHRAGILCLFCT